MSVIQIKDLHFRYPSEKQDLLQIPDLEIQAGEKVFVRGPSGSGKSTWLELIAGIQLAQSGAVNVCGQDLTNLDEVGRDRFRADHLGFIFQNFNLLPFLNVRENIQLGISFSPVRRGRVKEGDVEHLLERLGLAGFADRRAQDLSVGQAQRVAAARALLGRPEIILADEPTSALDSDHREAFLRLLFDVVEESQMTLIFVSHDRSLASLFHRSLDLTDWKGGGQ